MIVDEGNFEKRRKFINKNYYIIMIVLNTDKYNIVYKHGIVFHNSQIKPAFWLNNDSDSAYLMTLQNTLLRVAHIFNLIEREK